MRIQFLFWLPAIIALAATSCGSFEVEAGFKQPIELTAEAKVPRPTDTPMPQPTATPEASHVTYEPLPDGGLITLQEAKARVQTFLGARDLELEGWFVDYSASYVTAGSKESKGEGGLEGGVIVDLKEFIVQHQVAEMRYPDVFKVDAKTGEVTEATLLSNRLVVVSKQPMTEAEARSAAETFARNRFAGFDQLTLRKAEKWTPPGDDPYCPADGDPFCGDPQFGVVWARRAPESGAWLPLQVAVNINLKTGAVSSYRALRVDYTGPTVATVNRDQAIKLALDEARKDPQLAKVALGNVELTVSPINVVGATRSGQYRLAWFVGLEDVVKGKQVRHFLVDALYGTILNPVGTPLG